MGKIKGTRKGLQVLKLDNTLIHKLYDTDIVKIEYQTWGYTNVILNSGGWKTRHTKICMNDVLDQFNLKVIQKDFNWFLVDNDNIIAWDFEDGMNLGISLDNTIVKWGDTTHMRRKA
jgi:signal peptidase I